MAEEEEKTEEATAKKISKAREEGNVPKSQDTSGFITIAVAFAGLIMLFDLIKTHTINLVVYYFSILGIELSVSNVIEIMIFSIKETLIIVLPLSLMIMVAGIASNVAQFGWNFTTKPIMPNFSKLNPIAGIKNLFSVKKAIEGTKITLKSLGSLAVASYFFWDFIEELPTVALFTFSDQMDWMIEKAIYMTMIMLFIMLVFAIIDFWITRYQYSKSLKMTKQEVKDEFKNSEGDPRIKAKIRQKQFQMHRQRMMSNVKNADVVVTNPTHYAVALQYDQTKHNAPVVIAKGVDHVAIKIKELARENSVPIVQNPPLARSLYAQVELDHPIPETLYKAVVDVLAYVYKSKGKKFGS